MAWNARKNDFKVYPIAGSTPVRVFYGGYSDLVHGAIRGNNSSANLREFRLSTYPTDTDAITGTLTSVTNGSTTVNDVILFAFEASGIERIDVDAVAAGQTIGGAKVGYVVETRRATASQLDAALISASGITDVTAALNSFPVLTSESFISSDVNAGYMRDVYVPVVVVIRPAVATNLIRQIRIQAWIGEVF